MAQEIINIGTTPNDGLGDPLRTAFTKCNDNFTELYGNSGNASIGNITFSGSNISSSNSDDNLYVTAYTNTGASINGDNWSQLYWCPDVNGNIDVFDPDGGGDTYSWIYVDGNGAHIDVVSTTPTYSYGWQFTETGEFNAPGNIFSDGNISTTGNVTGNIFLQTVIAVGDLPVAATVGAGARSFVNDADTVTFYANVGSGGSNNVPVFSDGISWRVG